MQMFNRKLANAYKTIFSTPEGQEVFKDLMKHGRLHEPTFVPGDPATTAFNEGMRRMALRIFSFVTTDEAEVERAVRNITLHNLNEDFNDR